MILTPLQILLLIVISWIAVYLIVCKICRTWKSIADSKAISKAYAEYLVKKKLKDE